MVNTEQYKAINIYVYSIYSSFFVFLSFRLSGFLMAQQTQSPLHLLTRALCRVTVSIATAHSQSHLTSLYLLVSHLELKSPVWCPTQLKMHRFLWVWLWKPQNQVFIYNYEACVGCFIFTYTVYVGCIPDLLCAVAADSYWWVLGFLIVTVLFFYQVMK